MQILSIALFVCCGVLLAGSCGSGSHKEKEVNATGRPVGGGLVSTVDSASGGLTKEDAARRASLVGDVRYELDVFLDRTAKFQGSQTIRFSLKDTPKEDLRLDFHKGEIKNFVVNGRETALRRTPSIVWLPAEALQRGLNVVRVDYTTEMQTDGTGLTRSVDPEDQSIYLYTQFEAFEAHKFMPCFDQPDLKATLTMKARAPREWQLITATRETKISAEGKEFRTWNFPESAVMSTYLFSLHAGPFKIFEDKFRGTPLRLFVRPTLAKYLDTKLWFETTKQGLGFFNSYFDFAYPFKKYDQVIVPNFNAGAMENTAAVTFSERYITRGKATREQELDVVSVILHEMAHMWFGNVTTMRWWGDLWLNESFATYMSGLAMHEATPYKEAWKDFFTDAKQSAYFADELSTTHPIESPVKDTTDAFANFDGITYGKGASTMKQLSRWIGAETFRNGVRLYFKNHAYGNTELVDFIAALQAVTKKDLTQWADVWLRQSGLDIIESSYLCDGQYLKSVTITVRPSARNPTAAFRPQAVELAFYAKDRSGLVRTRVKAVDLQRSSETWLETGACPAALHANHADHGYGKFYPDAMTIEALAENLSGVKDSFDRMMMWSTLWHLVRDQKMPLQRYAEIALRHLENESDLQMMSYAVRTLSHNRSYGSRTVLAYWPVATEQDRALRTDFVGKAERLYRSRLVKAAPGSREQTFWWDAHAGTALSQESLDVLSDALAGKMPEGLKLDQDRRWNAVNTLCRRADARCEDLLVTEKKRDRSDRGLKSALAAESVRPIAERKRRLFDDVLKGTVLTYHEKREIARSLFPFEQRAEQERFEEDYFNFVRKEKASSDLEFVTMVTGYFVPTNCSVKQSAKVFTFLDAEKTLPSPLYREIKETLDEDERCQAIRAFARGALL